MGGKGGSALTIRRSRKPESSEDWPLDFSDRMVDKASWRVSEYGRHPRDWIDFCRSRRSKTKLEEALIPHLERFLLELGNDFTFVARQR